MIVSASFRTDIPAFYGSWFRRRLDAGYCLVDNPYGGQAYRVSLRREDVDGFVFWTRNTAPFLETLEVVRQRGYPFVLQFTITGYPRELEQSVPETERAVAQFRALAEAYGHRTAVWRYDPILISSLTPAAFHLENFARLAGALAGATDEVVVSLAHCYRKTRRNLDASARAAGFTWEDPPDEEKSRVAALLAASARDHGMRLTLCSQPRFLSPGIEETRCVDADRLSAVAGRPVSARLQGNRPDCRCFESRDIGAYDSCPHGCVYCYAVNRRDIAARRCREHDPAGEFLYRRRQLPEQRDSQASGAVEVDT